MRWRNLSCLPQSLFWLAFLVWFTGTSTAWPRFGLSTSPRRVTRCMSLLRPCPRSRLHCQAGDAFDASTHSAHDTIVVERARHSEFVADGLPENATLEGTAGESESGAPIKEDPMAAALAAREGELRERLASLEDSLRQDRLALARLHDQISESGKTGFFLVKAQVNDFLRNKADEQKAMVNEIKKDFVEKMVPIVQMFRRAPLECVACSERERAMHENFGALLNSIVGVIEKYGFKHLLEERTKEPEGKGDAPVIEIEESSSSPGGSVPLANEPSDGCD